MKQINNKGLTTIEILVTFMITAVLAISMYASITNLKNKETIASYKQSMITYRDLLTKEIQDDLIIKHLVSVEKVDSTKVIFNFKDGTSSELSIEHNFLTSSLKGNLKLCNKNNATSSDRGAIIYNEIKYSLPDLGSDFIDTGSAGCRKIYSLEMRGMDVTVDKDRTDSLGVDYVLNVKIKLWHPDFGDKYSINIVCPIDYV